MFSWASDLSSELARRMVITVSVAVAAATKPLVILGATGFRHEAIGDEGSAKKEI